METGFRDVSFDPQIFMKGYTPIQRQEMVDKYLEKVDSMWMVMMCKHDLLDFGDVSAGSLIGFHWLEHLCPELGNWGDFMQQTLGMLFNSPYLEANDVNRMKQDHFLKEMDDHSRAGWELFYLLCKYLRIPVMFVLQQGVFVTQDQIFQLESQRAIFVCSLKERIRVLRPKFHNLFGIYTWLTDPVTAREIMMQSGKGKGKKSSGGPKRKRASESLLERTRDILGDLMEQVDLPPAKKTSLSGEGETSGIQTSMPPEITTMTLEVTMTTATETTSGEQIMTTAVAAPAAGATVVLMAVVSGDDGARATTSREAESQEQGTPTKTERTGTTSTVSFMPGELHQERGPPSQSSGVSWESVLSGEPMLIGRGHGRVECPKERPAATPHEPGGRGEPHSPKPGMSGEYRGPAPGLSGDQRELRRAHETIQDLQDQVDSLMGINNNLEMDLDSHRVLVQDYEGEVKKMKLENASVKVQLMAIEKKNKSTERLLLEAQGKLREAGSVELENLRRIAESRADQLTLLQASLEGHKKALQDQIGNYHRVRLYTLAMERHYREAALNTLRARLPRPNDLLPKSVVQMSEGPFSVVITMPIPVLPIPVPVTTPLAMTTPMAVTTVPPITTAPVVATTPVDTTPKTTVMPGMSQGEPNRVRASGSGLLRAAMVNWPLIPVLPIMTAPVVFHMPTHVPVTTGGRVSVTRAVGTGVPTTSGIVHPQPAGIPFVPIQPALQRTRVSTAAGVMAGGVVAPTVRPTVSRRGQVPSPMPGQSRDVQTPPPGDEWSMLPAVPVDPQPMFHHPVVGPSAVTGQKTPGESKKRKDPSPSKVPGQVEPDEETTQKGKWHTCPECPSSGLFAVLHQFATHMFDVHNYSWVCPVCGRILMDKGKLNFHVQRVHRIPGKMYTCYYPGCGKVFTTAQYLIDHFPIHGCEHACQRCGRGHRKRTDRQDHERWCKGPFNCDEYEALREHMGPVGCPICGKIFMQAEYTAHLEACNQKYLERRKGKRHPTQTEVEEGRPACPQQGEQTAGLPSTSILDAPQPSQHVPTPEDRATSTSAARPQGEVPQGLTRVEGRHNVATRCA